jgi:hypothetical protein
LAGYKTCGTNEICSYRGIYYSGVEDGYRRIHISYVDEELDLPDYLKDLTILAQEKWEPLI